MIKDTIAVKPQYSKNGEESCPTRIRKQLIEIS